MPRKKGEQTDFRRGGIHGIKAGAFFYYHSIIKRKTTQEQSKIPDHERSTHNSKIFKEE
jgi:hypothetical protein